MNNFKKLIVWQKVRGLVKSIYNLTTQLFFDEKFDLISQTKRRAVSIPFNIAEGVSSVSTKKFAHALETAFGSYVESETQLLLCLDRNLIQTNTIDTIITDLKNFRKWFIN